MLRMLPEHANDSELQKFSEYEIQDAPIASAEAEMSNTGSSAPILTNPCITEVPISIPILPSGTSKNQSAESIASNYPTHRANGLTGLHFSDETKEHNLI